MKLLKKVVPAIILVAVIALGLCSCGENEFVYKENGRLQEKLENIQAAKKALEDENADLKADKKSYKAKIAGLEEDLAAKTKDNSGELYDDAYNRGYKVGLSERSAEVADESYERGREKGFSVGYEEGLREGYKRGINRWRDHWCD
jgi:FtsZ-binding cell division protein ZapB